MTSAAGHITTKIPLDRVAAVFDEEIETATARTHYRMYQPGTRFIITRRFGVDETEFALSVPGAAAAGDPTELVLTRTELLKAIANRVLEDVGSRSGLRFRWTDAGYLLDLEREEREHRVAAEAQGIATEAEAAAEEHLVFEARWAPLVSQGLVKLNARVGELQERLSRGREDIESAKATLAEASQTHRVLVVRVARGDRDATKERDAAEKRLDTAAKALREAEMVLEADEAQLRPELDGHMEAVRIIEERERLQRERADAEASAREVMELYRAQVKGARELEAATAALRARGAFAVDPLYRVALLYEHVANLERTASKESAR